MRDAHKTSQQYASKLYASLSQDDPSDPGVRAIRAEALRTADLVFSHAGMDAPSLIRFVRAWCIRNPKAFGIAP